MAQSILIDKEFQALIPPLSAEEKQQLEANLVADGCRDPLVVWGNTLIDGHNRYEICTRLGLRFLTVAKEFDDRGHVIEWIIRNQFGRRNLIAYVRTQLALRLESVFSERAKVNQQGGQGGILLKQNSAEATPIETRKEVAKAAGVSHDTVAKVKRIEADATPEVKASLAAGDVSINQVFTQIKKVEKQQAREAAIAVQTQTAKIQPTVEMADAIEWLDRQEPCDLLLTDPPYSTDVDDIAAFAKSWLPLALSKVKPTGRAFIFIGAYPAELEAYLSTAMPEQVLVWTYRNTLGPTPSHNYKLNWQAILYFKGKDAAPLDCPVMLEQFSVQDISAPDGRQGDRYHAWQKPLEIANRFIRHTTKEGDLILDPFACTGTFLIAASALGRLAKGCDISEENITIAGERGCLISK